MIKRYFEKLAYITKNNQLLLKNFSYITTLQIFLLIAPLITYPYLVRVLGRELYGIVLTAQMLASYASLIIDFGSNSVCAKHVSINRDSKVKLSEIVSSVLCIRSVLFIACFFLYMLVVFLVPVFREYYILFILTYGLTFNDLLFPQYFFQGIENMKMITFINIITKLFFIILIFILVKSENNYVLVPILYTLGYTIGGLISLYIIFKKNQIKFYIPPFQNMMIYFKDSSTIFATDVMRTIKDKLNYMFVGSFSGMENVVVYDLGLKLNSLVSKPLSIISIVLFPRFAKNRNVGKLKPVIWMSLIISIILVTIINIFLTDIVLFFLNEPIDLLPIRLFLLAPIMLSVSSIISTNLFIAFGYNRYVFYSIIITTIAYIISLFTLYFAHQLNNVNSFILLALISYFTELLYRMIISKKVIKLENTAQKSVHSR